MDGERFDALVKAAAGRTPRRGALRLLAGGALAALLAGLGLGEAAAACRRLGARCGKGDRCCGGGRCKRGKCRCPAGAKACDGRCVPAAECCGGCPEGKVCRDGGCACDGERCSGACPCPVSWETCLEGACVCATSAPSDCSTHADCRCGAGLVCREGRCASCTPVGELCAEAGECCQTEPTFCHPRLNRSGTRCCREQGGACRWPDDCCGSLGCSGGVCVSAPV